MRNHQLSTDITPVGMSSKSSRNVSEKAERHDKEDLLDAPVGTLSDKPPENQASERNDEIYQRGMGIIGQHLDSGPDTEEFRYSHTCISNEQSKHCQRSPAYAKLLTYEVCQPFAGDDSHTSAHLLHNSQAEARNG